MTLSVITSVMITDVRVESIYVLKLSGTDHVSFQIKTLSGSVETPTNLSLFSVTFSLFGLFAE